jgi:hypothetical protein
MVSGFFPERVSPVKSNEMFANMVRFTRQMVA